jgi:hypothetical protein
VPHPAPGADPDGRPTVPAYDRHLRRGLWIVALGFMVGAAVVYAAKAADDRSAFIRWRKQVLEFVQGVNIYDKYFFPNPPLMPLSLYPLMVLPKVTGAVVWFGLKVLMAAIAAWLCMRMVARPDASMWGEVASWLRNLKNLTRQALNPKASLPAAEIPARPIPSWVQLSILLLSLRPILSDLHHGNNNILILFLVVGSLAAWRAGYDVLAGLLLALSVTYKVTPALFGLYYIYKGSWRTVAASALGMGLFLLAVPSLFLGPEFNGLCLATWWHRILRPYVSSDVAGVQEINQSMIGTAMRILTKQVGDERYSVQLQHLHLFSLDPKLVVPALKVVSVAILGLLAWLCRTKTARRDDPRLLGEFSLIVLAMLFISERSWKHHYVTVLLPFTYLAYRAFSPKVSRGARAAIGGALVLSTLLMATTSTEVGNLFAHKQDRTVRTAPSARFSEAGDSISRLIAKGEGHKVAQFYGMFFWAGVVLFAATAWRVRVEREQGAASEREMSHYLPAPRALRRRSTLKRQTQAAP